MSKTLKPEIKPKTMRHKSTFTVEEYQKTSDAWRVKHTTDERAKATTWLDKNYKHGFRYRIVKQISDLVEFQEETVTRKVRVSGPMNPDASQAD